MSCFATGFCADGTGTRRLGSQAESRPSVLAAARFLWARAELLQDESRLEAAQWLAGHDNVPLRHVIADCATAWPKFVECCEVVGDIPQAKSD